VNRAGDRKDDDVESLDRVATTGALSARSGHSRIGAPKSQGVADALRRAILLVELEPGQRLREMELAEMFGTSQGPVREALRVLTGEGLVIRLPHRGTYVTEVHEADIREAYQLRVIVEARAARLLILSWSEQKEEALRGAIDLMDAAVAADDTIALADADLEFHRRLCALAGPPVLVSVWSSLANQIRRYKTSMDQRFPDGMAQIPRLHEPLVELLRAGNADAVAEALREHIYLGVDIAPVDREVLS